MSALIAGVFLGVLLSMAVAHVALSWAERSQRPGVKS